mmetsp:Transcript_55705/g.99183  ORF Transcript_55705/g.99183 Transcript_55705/m.99183 type:complete len:140 (-) Transcript_55705:98-517(-)
MGKAIVSVTLAAALAGHLRGRNDMAQQGLSSIVGGVAQRFAPTNTCIRWPRIQTPPQMDKMFPFDEMAAYLFPDNFGHIRSRGKFHYCRRQMCPLQSWSGLQLQPGWRKTPLKTAVPIGSWSEVHHKHPLWHCPVLTPL